MYNLVKRSYFEFVPFHFKMKPLKYQIITDKEGGHLEDQCGVTNVSGLSVVRNDEIATCMLRISLYITEVSYDGYDASGQRYGS